jgi:hypothetical protein
MVSSSTGLARAASSARTRAIRVPMEPVGNAAQLELIVLADCTSAAIFDGDFGTSPLFCGNSRTSRCLSVLVNCGLGRKAQWASKNKRLARSCHQLGRCEVRQPQVPPRGPADYGSQGKPRPVGSRGFPLSGSIAGGGTRNCPTNVASHPSFRLRERQ